MEDLLENGQNGFARIREQYKRRCVTLGKEIRILSAGEERHGTAVDIGADGSLICEIGGELVSVNAGEVSVRGMYGYV